jgi:hypothetical protein
MKKIQNQPLVKKGNSLKEQLTRYKFAERNKDIRLKKKSGYGVIMELNSKSKTSKALLDESLELYLTVYLEHRPSPFIYDRPVTGPYLLNRQKEMEWALDQIQVRSLVILYGASGFGKTSIAVALQEELMKNNELVVGYVSFREATSEWDLVKRYVEAMYRAMGVPDYRWGCIDESNFDRQLLANYYDMPTAFAKRLGKKLIAIVDDFNAIYALPHAASLEARFSATWQPDASNQRHISAIVLQNITYDTLVITPRKRALADTGTKLFLEKIPYEVWIADVKKKFANKSIDDSTIRYIIQKMNHIPQRIQSLCHQLFIIKSKVITKRLVDKMIDHLLSKVSLVYEARLGLLSKLQQALLYSFADKTELNIPPIKRFKTYLSLDEFVFHHKGERVFRDPFLEAYILKRNNIAPKHTAKWKKFKDSDKSGDEKNFDDKEWTWE